MGGVLRLGKAARIFRGGDEVSKLYHDGNVLWAKPIRSVFPNPGISATDNVIGVGSSDLACTLYATWNLTGGSHHWLGTFRDDYDGDMINYAGGVVQPGFGSAITLGRRNLHEILEIADGGGYPDDQDPLISMGDYDALIMDAQDQGGGYPAWVPSEVRIQGGIPMPYLWNMDGSQKFLNYEFGAQMRLVRLARQNNISRMYLTTPWPRLISSTDSTTDAAWRTYFPNIEKTMHYQQDRINYQIEQENLGGHVSLIPFHKIIERIYDDIQTGTAPAYLTEIRVIFANGDQQGDATVPTTEKHIYMLNHIGSYALSCLVDRIVFNHDPRGKPNTDGGNWTVPSEVATYIQNIAVEIADGYGRAGRGGRTNIGYSMLPIKNRTPEETLGSDLRVNHVGLVNTGETVDFTSTGPMRHFFAVFTFNAAQIPTEGINLFDCFGSTTSRRMSLNAVRSAPNDNISFFYQQENAGPSCQAALWSGDFITKGNGVTRFLVEGYTYTGTGTDNYGLNMGFNITDLTLDPETMPAFGVTRNYAVAHTTGTTVANVNRFTVTAPGVTVHHMIGSSRNLTDQERFDLFRYLSRTHQVATWEIFTPDLMVQNVNTPPTLTSLPAQNAVVGTPFELDLSSYASDPDGAVIFSATGLPSGLSIADDGQITGIPTTIGNNSAVITVTDTGGLTASQTLPFTVEFPVLNYDAGALIYYESGMPIVGTDTAVTGVAMRGTAGITMSSIGSGTEVTNSAAGLSFTEGKYLQRNAMSGLAMGDGIFVLTKITLNNPPISGTQDILSGTGKYVRILSLSPGANLTVQAVGDSNVNSTNMPITYPRTFVIGGEMDDVANTFRVLGINGTMQPTVTVPVTNPAATVFNLMKNVNGTLERLVVVGRPEGGQWPITFEAAIADFLAA